MASFQADNFLQLPHNGAYGNYSIINGTYANLQTSSAAGFTGSTFDLVKIPAGAEVCEATIISTQMTGTSTLAIGVRYADGTSTGGTTGTAIIGTSALTASAATGTIYYFMPFTNDADTIIYATMITGPTPATNDNIELMVKYQARGSK